MMHGRACKQYIFYFQCYVFQSKSFHVTVRKRRQKQFRVSNFALLLVVFKWHHGSEGVNTWILASCRPRTVTTGHLFLFYIASIHRSLNHMFVQFTVQCQNSTINTCFGTLLHWRSINTRNLLKLLVTMSRMTDFISRHGNSP